MRWHLGQGQTAKRAAEAAADAAADAACMAEDAALAAVVLSPAVNEPRHVVLRGGGVVAEAVDRGES